MGKMGKLKTRNYLAINAWNRSGAGVHRDKKKLLIEDLLDQEIEESGSERPVENYDDKASDEERQK